MTLMRPYLLRAMYEWMVDNQFTPHILVNANHDNVKMPPNIAKDGQVIFNISPSAVRSLELSNEWVSFNARFSGQAYNVYLPILAILAIYAQENERAMSFPPEEEITDSTSNANESSPNDASPSKPARNRPNLKVVK